MAYYITAITSETSTIAIATNTIVDTATTTFINVSFIYVLSNLLLPTATPHNY